MEPEGWLSNLGTLRGFRMQLVFGQSPHIPVNQVQSANLPGTRVEVLDENYEEVPIGKLDTF